VASLAGVRDTVSYEGQAAVELEWLATQMPCDGSYPFEITTPHTGPHVATVGGPPKPSEIDTRPLIRALLADVEQGAESRKIARRFHSTIVEIIAATCGAIRQETTLAAVALSGGVFMNALIATETAARLRADGFRVYRHIQVPPNDGGICLGQLAIGAAVLADREVDPLIDRAGVVSSAWVHAAKVSELHRSGAFIPTSNSQKMHAPPRSASEQSADRIAGHSQVSRES
jgi:hydrogenase maturation protein HypF